MFILMSGKAYDNGSSDLESAMDDLSVRIQLGGSINVCCLLLGKYNDFLNYKENTREFVIFVPLLDRKEFLI